MCFYGKFPEYQSGIPHFKQVIVMATTCECCGHRSNEVKSGTGISEHGVRIQLKLTDPSDLSRDILMVIITQHYSICLSVYCLAWICYGCEDTCTGHGPDGLLY